MWFVRRPIAVVLLPAFGLAVISKFPVHDQMQLIGEALWPLLFLFLVPVADGIGAFCVKPYIRRG